MFILSYVLVCADTSASTVLLFPYFIAFILFNLSAADSGVVVPSKLVDSWINCKFSSLSDAISSNNTCISSLIWL